MPKINLIEKKNINKFPKKKLKFQKKNKIPKKK